MKRFRYAHAARLAVGALALATLCGCTVQNTTTVSNFFEFIQTILLGVTAAGAVVIMRNV